VKADYVASYRADGAPANNAEILKRFALPEGGLDVLVNVQIVTEGVDIPSIKTVFLTRPTASEILFRQMIGRALRGPKVHGTVTAYLVSFEDHWEVFPDFIDPIHSLVPEMETEAPEEPSTKDLIPQPRNGIPWDVYREIADSLRPVVGARTTTEVFEAVPHGWYVLRRLEDDDTVVQVRPVYEHQQSCWQAALEHLGQNTELLATPPAVDDIYSQFFDDCDAPRVPKQYVADVLEYMAISLEAPEFEEFEARKNGDPARVAARIATEDLPESKKQHLIEETFHLPIVQAVYRSISEYSSAVDHALRDLRYPGASEREHRGVLVFEPRADEMLSPPPPEHPLFQILQEMLAEGEALLRRTHLPARIDLHWTGRLIKGWYGKAYYDTLLGPGEGEIRINCLLNSPDVRRETIRFLLWHEYLHLYLKQGHTNEFRRLEALWPNKVDADHELDTLNQRFGIQYW
jgi:hypothetical protein